MTTGSSVFQKSVRFQCKRVLPEVEGEAGPLERFSRVPGTNLETFHKGSVTQVGCGGLGSNTGAMLLRKGIGRDILLDDDLVTLPNLGSQRFYPENLYLNKALCCGRNLQREATWETEILCYPVTLQEALKRGYDVLGDVLLILVDNEETRVDGSRTGIQYGLPVIFAGVGTDGTHGYVFVQEPGKACFACMNPEVVAGGRTPCPGAPTCIDILQILSALVAYAVDSILMERPRHWNYRTCCLSGEMPDGSSWVERRPDCPLCGENKLSSKEE